MQVVIVRVSPSDPEEVAEMVDYSKWVCFTGRHGAIECQRCTDGRTSWSSATKSDNEVHPNVDKK
jgi:hypothetical protein